MTTRSVWWRSLAAVGCWSGVVCLAEDRSADQPRDVDPPVVVVEVNAQPSEKGQQVQTVVDPKAQPEDIGRALNFLVTPPAKANGVGGPTYTVFTSDGGQVLLSRAAGGAGGVEPGKYWIGLLCVDPGDALRAQLGLDEGVGLLVDAVTDDSPAKKAGIVRHDVLLSSSLSGDKTDPTARALKQVKDLVDAVQASETRVLNLEIIRKGERQVVPVTPAERPLQKTEGGQPGQEDKLSDAHLVTPYGVLNLATASGNPGQNNFLMRMAGPLFTAAAPVLPEGMTMEFHQVVGQAEKIIVKQGDQSWELTAATLDKVPDEVRAAVLEQLASRQLQQMPPVVSLPFMGMPPGTIGLPAGVRAMPVGSAAVTQPGGVEVNSPPHRANAATVYSGPTAPASSLGMTAAVPLLVTSTSVAHLPNGVTVTIVRTGSDSTKVTVKKVVQTWEVSEKELDKLPEELRKPVETFLKESARSEVHRAVGGGVLGLSAPPHLPYGFPSGSSGLVTYLHRTHQDQLRDRGEIREQLKQLNDKIEQLQQALEKSVPKQ